MHRTQTKYTENAKRPDVTPSRNKMSAATKNGHPESSNIGVLQQPRLGTDSSEAPEEGLFYPQERTFDLDCGTSEFDPKGTWRPLKGALSELEAPSITFTYSVEMTHSRLSCRFITPQVVEYRSVVSDVDPVFSLTDEWYEAITRSKPPIDEPWYHVLVDGMAHMT